MARDGKVARKDSTRLGLGYSGLHLVDGRTDGATWSTHDKLSVFSSYPSFIGFFGTDFDSSFSVQCFSDSGIRSVRFGSQVRVPSWKALGHGSRCLNPGSHFGSHFGFGVLAKPKEWIGLDWDGDNERLSSLTGILEPGLSFSLLRHDCYEGYWKEEGHMGGMRERVWGVYIFWKMIGLSCLLEGRGDGDTFFQFHCTFFLISWLILDLDLHPFNRPKLFLPHNLFQTSPFPSLVFEQQPSFQNPRHAISAGKQTREQCALLGTSSPSIKSIHVYQFYSRDGEKRKPDDDENRR
ncbi:hypothetical protein K402DRAFT_103175 [Aulographum hederae CBS 113979]|uniref:Uncharacterized protein n=1 Tax=Aulographum hederae CBS 113979 TaxID=1176131 RepID=A0A6G1GXP3_9PEZI|nr:hypothetical protein K402DRAFT_103175 [Aulographum hederae CBS 113979]